MQVTTITLFRFEGLWAKCWAFAQMGLAPRRVGAVSGLQFIKFVGSGAANGFGIRPNFGTYGIFAIWDSERDADFFFQKNAVFQSYQAHSVAHQTAFLANTMSHGAWDGRNPFQASAEFDPNQPVAVLTRATIRRRHLWRFWRDVPSVSRDIEGRAGLQFAVGIGELPLVQQATFSLWESGRHMMDYAYRGQHHAEVIKRTRALGWYKEELFARFTPIRITDGPIFDLQKK
jgi:hypothetical protein